MNSSTQLDILTSATPHSVPARAPRLAIPLSCEQRVRHYGRDLAAILKTRSLIFLRAPIALSVKLRRREEERLKEWAEREVSISENAPSAVLVTNDLGALAHRAQTVLIPKGEQRFDRLGRKRFLVPVGQDDAGLRALACALPFAKAAHATIVIYHTTWRKNDVASDDPWHHMTDMSRRTVLQAIETVNRAQAAYELVLEIEAPGVPEGIVRTANDRKTCLIAMAYSKRNIRGSKAEMVAHTTNIPLLIAGDAFEAEEFPQPSVDAKPPTNIPPPLPPAPLPNPWLDVKRVMAIAIILTIIKAAAKIWLGRSIGSNAIVADGAHSMSDAVPDLLVIWIALLARQLANRSYPLGRGNLNTLVTLGTGIALAFVCLNVTWNIVLALYHAALHENVSNLKMGPHELPYAMTVTIMSALISFAVGSYQIYAGKKTREPSVAVDGAEMRGDALIECATAGGLFGAYLFNAAWIEHVIGAFVLYFVGRTAKEFLVNGVRGLTQKSLGEDIENAIATIAGATYGVARTGTLKTFAIGGTTAVVMLKIETVALAESSVVQDAVRRALAEHFTTLEDFSRCEIWIEEAERAPTRRIAIALNGSRVATRLAEADRFWICEVATDGTVSTVNNDLITHLALPERAALLSKKKTREVVTFFEDEADSTVLNAENITVRASLTFTPGAIFYG